MKNEFYAAQGNFEAEFIDSLDILKAAAAEFQPDAIIIGSDCLSHEKNRFNPTDNPDIPVICLAGDIDCDAAVELIKQGFTDIVLKNNIKTLVPKIRRAVEQLRLSVCLPDAVCPEFKLAYSAEFGSNAIFENCMEGILVTVPDGEIISANPAACEMFGMTEAELIEKGRMGIVDTTDPNLERLLNDRRTKGKAKGEIRLIKKDGTYFPAIVSSVLFTNSFGATRTVLIVRDITTFRESEQQLIKTKAELTETLRKLNKTLEASQDIICSFDNQARFVTINGACEAIWGYTPGELIGKVCFDFVIPQDRNITTATDQQIKAGNPAMSFENRYIHKSGRIVNMLWSAKWDETEQLIYATAKDITEQKKLEKAVNIERRRFLDLYELAPCCLGIIKGPEYIFELANPLYLQLINKGPEIIGKRVKEVLPELEEQGVFDLLDEVYNTGKSFVANERLLQFDMHKNGTLSNRYLNFMYMPHRDGTGDIDGILFFAIDVTEQVVSRLKIEESANLYQSLLMELPVAAYSCDAEGKISIFNKAAVNLWGREPEIGKDMWCGSVKTLTPDGNPIALEDCPMAIALKEGRTVSGAEIIIERENGERRNILPHAVPYFNASNQIMGAVNMLTDITESKTAAKDLKRHNKELRKANTELDRFVYSVSHDLRAPLTSIMGIAGFIEDESAEPETVAHIKMIKDSINRLDGFIRKILTYSQNNRTSVDIEPIEVTQKTLSTIDSLRNMMPSHHIDFHVDIDEDVKFSSDLIRFNAIIENLISNAIKYHNPTVFDKFIKITGQVTKDEFRFSVSDNGIGIAPEYHEKIFDMFFRISGNSEGSGIGLYIVKDMVERLGGTISVRSTDQVTTFDVVLKNFPICQN